MSKFAWRLARDRAPAVAPLSMTNVSPTVGRYAAIWLVESTPPSPTSSQLAGTARSSSNSTLRRRRVTIGLRAPGCRLNHLRSNLLDIVDSLGAKEIG